jgi:hypothetical protein
MKFIPFLAFNLTINNNVVATKITRRNTMHKNTRSILGKPFSTREENPAKSFAIFFKRKTFTTKKDLAHKRVLKP